MTLGRAETLARLQRQPLDVLVVGGGVVGAGAARDLALRGFRVGLVEQHDFASGTSSRPTRLIHGGLRYLEMFDFGLVRSDMREREILLSIAPHLVRPLPFLMPEYGADRVYHAKLRAGMQLYDALSFDKSLPRRRWLKRDEVLAAEPGLSPDGLRGAWRFYDAQIALVERLVIENVLDAAEQGALMLNHATVTGYLRDERGAVVGARVHDALSGQDVDVRARLVVNASGPWLDRTTRPVRAAPKPLLRLTKGVHLVTPPFSRYAQVLFTDADGRLFFVVPWLGMSLVGTTDTDYTGDPSDVAATREDVDYLAAAAGRAFPEAPVGQVYYTFAGLRALVRVEGMDEGKVSRKHALWDHERRDGVPGVLSVVGGKITAYRGIAEEVGDLASRKLGRLTRPYSALRPLPGARGMAVSRKKHAGLRPGSESPAVLPVPDLAERAAGLGLAPDQVAHLAAIYGALAHAVLDVVQDAPETAARVARGEPVILAELVRATRDEWAETLGDVLLRRLPVGLGPKQGLDVLAAYVRAVGDLRGWDDAECAEQAAAYRAELAPMRRFSSSSSAEVVV